MCRMVTYASFDEANRAATEAAPGSILSKEGHWRIVTPCRKGTPANLTAFRRDCALTLDAVNLHSKPFGDGHYHVVTPMRTRDW